MKRPIMAITLIILLLSTGLLFSVTAIEVKTSVIKDNKENSQYNTIKSYTVKNIFREKNECLYTFSDEETENDTLVYDLEAVSIRVSPSNFDKGEKVKIIMTVHNAAKVISHWFKVTLYYDGNWWGDHVIGMLANDSGVLYRPPAYNRQGELVGPVYIYDTESISRDFYWPDDYNNHSLQMFCDSTGRYDETNESNNYARITLKAEEQEKARFSNIFNGRIIDLLSKLFSLELFQHFLKQLK